MERPSLLGVGEDDVRLVGFEPAAADQLGRGGVDRDPTCVGAPVRDLERRASEIAAWAGALPERSRYGIVQALRQALEAAVRWGAMTQNPAKLAGRNPQPKPEEIHPFTQADIDLLAAELGEYGPLVIFASETGMRPSEWRALEWRDVDRTAGLCWWSGRSRSARRRRTARSPEAAAARRSRQGRS